MNDILRKITDSIKNLFGGNGKNANGSVLGVDIGSAFIKVVQMKKENGKAVLETYGSIALGAFANTDAGKVTNLDGENLAKALIELFKESGITPSETACVIPASSSLVFVISLPANISESIVKDIVPTEARKFIPVPITEVSLDYFILPKREIFDQNPGEMSDPSVIIPEEKTEVLLVAIHNDTVKKYQQALSGSGIDSSFLEVELFSQVRSVFIHELAPVLLMDMGASKTKLAIVEYGIVKSVHIINRGSADITQNIATTFNISFTEAEKMKMQLGMGGDAGTKELQDSIHLSTEYILSETNSIVLHYEKQHNRSISKVILTGGGVLLHGFFEKAQDNFKCEVVYGNPFYKVEAPAFLAPTLSSIGPEFSGAVGVALRKLLS